jgi:NO-binding membrane sensor protein with MHYT domain
VASAHSALAVTALAALLGVIAGRALFGRRRARALALVLGCAAMILVGFAEARYGRMLYNPLIAVLALVIASELSVRVHGAIGK